MLLSVLDLALRPSTPPRFALASLPTPPLSQTKLKVPGMNQSSRGARRPDSIEAKVIGQRWEFQMEDQQ